MSIEDAIYSRASGYAGLSALVVTRIYPDKLPQKPTYPAVTYQRVSSQRPAAMNADVGVMRERFQFDVWATTRASQDAVAAQVLACFARWRGTVSDIVVQDSYFENRIDLGEDPNIPGLRHTALDFEINYEG